LSYHLSCLRLFAVSVFLAQFIILKGVSAEEKLKHAVAKKGPHHGALMVQHLGRPSAQPSGQPSAQPSGQPSAQSSGQPSAKPSGEPSAQPSSQPSAQPSGQPSAQPSGQPSAQPSGQPSAQPSGQPSAQPSSQPSAQPSGQPSAQPSGQPSAQPSGSTTANPVKMDVTWKLENTPKDWEIIYDGYGFVSFSQSQGIILEPKSVESPADTQAALVLATKSKQTPLRNFTISLQVSTDRQTRKKDPNAWEVFWLFFNYTVTSDGTKYTNYLVFKPTGVELGIAYGQRGQKFLATASNPVLTLGKIANISLTKIDKMVHVFIDGAFVLSYHATQVKDDLLDLPGCIGLYSEDAKVHIRSVTVQPLDP
jgi:hypothetical protein